MADEVSLPEGKDRFKLNEVCKLANVQPYMLRFWATEFPRLEAEKTGTGQRVYTREQVELILEIRRLLYEEHLTIAGVKKRLAEGTPPPRARRRRTGAARPAREAEGTVDTAGGERVQHLVETLRAVRDELAEVIAALREPS